MKLKEPSGVLVVGRNGLDVCWEIEVAAGSQGECDQRQYDDQRDGEDDEAFLHAT